MYCDISQLQGLWQSCIVYIPNKSSCKCIESKSTMLKNGKMNRKPNVGNYPLPQTEKWRFSGVTGVTLVLTAGMKIFNEHLILKRSLHYLTNTKRLFGAHATIWIQGWHNLLRLITPCMSPRERPQMEEESIKSVQSLSSTTKHTLSIIASENVLSIFCHGLDHQADGQGRHR